MLISLSVIFFFLLFIWPSTLPPSLTLFLRKAFPYTCGRYCGSLVHCLFQPSLVWPPELRNWEVHNCFTHNPLLSEFWMWFVFTKYRSSGERLQNWVGWREKQSERPSSQRCREHVALGSAARVAALLFWQKEWLLLWSSSVVWWLEELLMAVYSRTCGFSTHSESHLILCNEYLSVSAA